MDETGLARAGRLRRIECTFAALVALALSGCVFQTVREQQAKADAVGTLSGTVTTERASRHPLVVVLLRRDAGGTSIADHFVLEKPGRWAFRATAGAYGLAAFEDANGDLRYDPGEPALYPGEREFFPLRTGETRDRIALRISADGRAPVSGPVDIAAVHARSTPDQIRATLGAVTVLGDVADLSDPRFADENGTKGMWAPFDFLFDVRPGVYFAAPYDPGKIPVLFVHGITGTPRNFARLAEGLDHERFQPWFFYYPSGARLEAVADYLAGLVTQLHVRHRFREIHVVAHSMGGLVARAFILRHAADGGDYVTRFVSIATPWSGHAAAQEGVEKAPAVVRSWLAMAPGSTFLDGLFYEDAGDGRARRRLPPYVRYGLLFAYRRKAKRFGESGDGVVTVASELRPEAQDEAALVRGIDETHRGVLDSPETAAALNALLR